MVRNASSPSPSSRLESELERAVADYLALSRGVGHYDPETYARAEERAWDRIVGIRRQLEESEAEAEAIDL